MSGIYVFLLVRLVLDILPIFKPKALWEILYGVFLFSFGVYLAIDETPRLFGGTLALVGIVWTAVAYFKWKNKQPHKDDQKEKE